MDPRSFGPQFTYLIFKTMQENIITTAIYIATILSISITILELLDLLKKSGAKVLATIIIILYMASAAFGFMYGIATETIPIITADSFAFLVGTFQLIKQFKGG